MTNKTQYKIKVTIAMITCHNSGKTWMTIFIAPNHICTRRNEWISFK